MEVEKKIENYIAKSIKNYKLSNERIADLKKNAALESKEHGSVYSKKLIANAIIAIKKNELRQQYFKLHPNDEVIFTDPFIDPSIDPPIDDELFQSCTDGGFETWPVAGNPWIFKHSSPFGAGGADISTTGVNFVPFAVGTTVNNFNASTYATLVSPGNDPVVGGAVPRVRNGQRAVKLNFAQRDNENTADAVTMSRNITINENVYDFSYSVILNNPPNTDIHPIENKPFFLVRIYDLNDNILRSVNLLTNAGDCSFTSTTRSGYDGTILYTGWRCARINTAGLMGQNVRVEFIVADCRAGMHFGTVYIDNVCSNTCANPLFGSIDFNATPTQFCPTTNQTVCGTFQIPSNSQYTSMLLNVRQSGTNSIVGSVNAPSSIDLTNRTFCFTVPLSAFGTNPTGDFEFQVAATFTRNCSFNLQLDPIYDFSANDTGPDVSFTSITPIFNQVEPVCFGTTISTLPTTSTNGISGSWSPAINSTATTTYTFRPNAGQCGSTTTMTIVITPGITPTFTAIAPVCKGSTLSALPTTSNNGITGDWSPALNNMTTTTYTFTPNPSLCVNTATVTIVVTPIVAVNDNFSTPINTLIGGDTPTVFTNDTLNGIAITGNTVTASIISSTPLITPTPTISSSGVISIPQGTAIGTYSIVYNITQAGCPTNFATATATVVVTEQVIVTPTIVPGLRANNIVELVDTQIDTQGNAKIIISGPFTAYNNIPCFNICRLNSDLTYDTNSGFVVSGPSPEMAVPLDMEVIKTQGADYNKIILVGSFTGFSGGSNSNGTGIVRLNANGSIDTNFNAAYSGPNKGASGSNRQIRTVFVFPALHPLAGKILIGGMFSAYNNNPANKLALLNADGSFDTTSGFNTSINTVTGPIIGGLPGFTSSPQTIGVQSDGKIIIGGYFNQYNGWWKLNIVRLFPNGALDNTFNNLYTGANPGILPNPTFGPYINKLAVQPDDRIIIAGQFTHYNNSSSNNLARLNANGTLDATFAVGTGFNNNVVHPITATRGLIRDLILDTGSSNWKLYACGDFTRYQGLAVDEIIRINCTLSPGSNDNNPQTGFNLANGGPNGANNGTVWSMKRQNDGKIVIGGQFKSYGPFSALNVTRIFPAPSSIEARMQFQYYDSEPEIDIFNTEAITVYPNPTNGLIHIKIPQNNTKKYQARLYNFLGQKVLEQNDVVESTIIDLFHLQKGTYIIVLSNGDESINKTILLNNK